MTWQARYHIHDEAAVTECIQHCGSTIARAYFNLYAMITAAPEQAPGHQKPSATSTAAPEQASTAASTAAPEQAQAQPADWRTQMAPHL